VFKLLSTPIWILQQQVFLSAAAARAGCDALLGAGNAVPIAGGLPSVVVVHSLHFLSVPDQVGRLRSAYRRLMVWLSVRRSKRVIAVSDSLRRDMERWLPRHAWKIEVVHEAVEDRFFDSRIEPDPFRDVHDLGESVVLFASTLWPYKNAEIVIRAAAERGMGRNVVIVICGGDWGNERKRLAALAAELGVRDRVRFLGHVPQDQMPRTYAWSDVFVYPSLCETFGLPLLEAMAAGVPVVASDVTSIPEVCGGAAVLVDPADSRTVAEAISQILGDQALSADLRARGRARAESMTWAATARRTMSIAKLVVADGERGLD